MLTCLPAGAFLPDQQEFMEEVRTSYSGLRNYALRAEFSRNETARLWRSDERWRQEWVMGDRLMAAAVGAGDRLYASWPAASSFPLPLTAPWRMADPMETLTRFGVDADTRSFAFLRDRPCLVLGRSGEGRAWIDTERKVVMRLVRQAPSGERLTLDYKDFKRSQVNWFPQAGKATHAVPGGEDEVIEFSLQWRGANMGLRPELFSPDALRSRLAGVATPSEQPAPLDALRSWFLLAR
ncbi:hypothetical protein [Desulfohalovibrio reitneri]|uniref:hypothetical protein n=1 Tax=Desulfohalovibrio reitneri TaxID=1307759 RepID=UPI000B2E61CD|nr:hypothetical protein [Desulfohalovibrio reitneri]